MQIQHQPIITSTDRESQEMERSTTRERRVLGKICYEIQMLPLTTTALFLVLKQVQQNVTSLLKVLACLWRSHLWQLLFEIQKRGGDHVIVHMILLFVIAQELLELVYWRQVGRLGQKLKLEFLYPSRLSNQAATVSVHAFKTLTIKQGHPDNQDTCPWFHLH